ncbi:hypothetical protein [Calycomorphotria hydatis]|uniref:Uncharacterized protein n=1 Tax=Calycomorphotria hydatis TaxID=2528027 RepID=A0A517T7Q0_9PLAN|nr:hypothetical protein [Calycomorphotria hydatis]QDT64405.1 hypothetical protein V22_16390 [Calycomorphotria hydatis]
MTAAGMTIMIVSIIVVVTTVSYCLYRVMTLPPTDVEELHGQPVIDTGDTADAD